MSIHSSFLLIVREREEIAFSAESQGAVGTYFSP